MDKIEFYHKLLQILNSSYEDYFIRQKRNYKTVLSTARIRGKKYFREWKDYKDKCKEYRKITFTYKDSCIIYDALSDKNWEFQDNCVVIHYDEVIMNKGNVINDIYLKFIPIIHTDCLYPNLTALRATYTSVEFVNNFLHPHIRFFKPYTGFINSICFGNTEFRASDNVGLNFICYLDYLDSFLKHEYNSNPFISTDRVKNVALNVYYNPHKVDFTKLDYTFESVKGVEYIVPDYTQKTIDYLDSLGYIGLFSYTANGWDYTHEKIDLEDSDNIFRVNFKGERVKLKIIEPTKKVLNVAFTKRFNEETRSFLTETYMEAHSRNFRTSYTPSAVSLQEDIF